FDPLVKLFYTPSVQDSIFQTETNLVSITLGTEALMFAVYLSATVTMSRLEGLESMESPKDVLLKRFANATQQALVNAKFLKSTDLVVLQALTLYLVGRWHRFGPSSRQLLTDTPLLLSLPSAKSLINKPCGSSPV